MDIGPISAILPVTMKPSPVAPDLSRVFEVEYLGHSQDDEYTPENRKPKRGLEDEEDESGQESGELDPPELQCSAGEVSIFV